MDSRPGLEGVPFGGALVSGYRFRSDAACRLLGDLVREGPARLHLVLSSREDPPFPVARFRAQGEANDLPGSALRFT